MSSHNKTANQTSSSTSEKVSTASSGSQHSLRKRHSPNIPAATVTTSGSVTGSSTSTVIEPTASYPKLRKVSAPASTKTNTANNSTTSKNSKSLSSSNTGHDTSSSSSSTKRAGTRELSALIQPFPDRDVSEERLTRSRAKTLVQKQKQVQENCSGDHKQEGKSKSTVVQSTFSKNEPQAQAKNTSTVPGASSSSAPISFEQSSAQFTGESVITALPFVPLDSSNCTGALVEPQHISVIASAPVIGKNATVATKGLEGGIFDDNATAQILPSLQQHQQIFSKPIPTSSFFNSTGANGTTTAIGASANNILENNLTMAQNETSTAAAADALFHSYGANADNFSLPPPVIMSNQLLQSTMAAAVQQHHHHIISSAANNDFGTFANQLATAAAVVVGSVTGTNTPANPAFSAGRPNVIFDTFRGPTSSFYQHYHPQQQQQNVDKNNGSNSAEDPSLLATSLIGINRFSLGASHTQQLQNQTTTAASMASMFGVGAKSQRTSGFLSTLVPRMQHLLNSTSGGSTAAIGSISEAIAEQASHYHHYMGGHHNHATSPAMQSIVEGLKSTNEIRQSEAASELAEMLLLGNEESLPNMPIVEIVQALCGLLQKDNNFELMLTAARCITNMQEALPRALPIIVEAIPLLLSKLKRIEYIDVAEQSLIALEVMSRRNGKQILLQGGISSTISHVDFFSLPSQRLAYQIAANSAIFVTHNEFQLVKDSIPDLTQRLIYVDDKRCIESICTFFNRIIENMRQHPDRLRQIIGGNHEFLQNVQPLILSFNRSPNSNLSSNTYLALLKSLRYIASQCLDAALALVRMDFGNTIRVLIAPELTYTTDTASEGETATDKISTNAGLNLRPAVQLKEIIALAGQLVENLPRGGEEVVSLLSLFPLLVEIGNNSSCSQLRNESLNVMRSLVKMVDKAEHLEPILHDIPLAVYITQMLSSNRNLGVLLSSLQLARAILEKLPRLYISLFEAEGVFYETSRLTKPIIDCKPQSTRAVMAEQILEGLVSTTQSSAQSSGASGMRVIIPPILFGQNNNNTQNHQQNIQEQQDSVCKEAKQIIDKYAGEHGLKKFNVKEPHKAKRIYDKLIALTNKFSDNKDHGNETLLELKNLLLEQDITSFQFNQSGIATALLTYLTDQSTQIHPQRKTRLKRFASVFMGLNEENLYVDSVGTKERHEAFDKLVQKLLNTIAAVEQFQVRITNLSGIITTSNGGNSSSMASYQSAILSGSGAHASLFTTTLRGAQALRFFQTHQIRVNLRRHPKCKMLREWRHGRGTIKVDPFTSVSSIERYLLERGIGMVGQAELQQQQPSSDDGDDDSEISEEDQDLSFTSTHSNESRIELYIGEQLLPTDMSILQAIRQYSLPQDDESAIDTIPSSIWLATHTIYYNSPNAVDLTETIASTATDNLLVGTLSTQNTASTASSTGVLTESDQTASETPQITSFTSLRSRTRLQQKQVGTSKKSGESTSSVIQAVNKEYNQVFKTGKIPARISPLSIYLQTNSKSSMQLKLNDPSTNCLILLNVLYGLNVFWWELFDATGSLNSTVNVKQQQLPPASHKSLIAQSAFLSAKLNAKVSRQLSDFLTVATQQIPKWTIDLMNHFPFVFSFSTRRSFLFCTSFGRDRALMHLVNEASNDDSQENGGLDATSRLIPRLERRKVSIKRENVLKEAQQIFTQLNTSKAMLEVGFDGEVGTGFGPTLEFYSTLSRSLQKYSLRLWEGNVQKYPEGEQDTHGDDDYVYAPNGLYPLMLARTLSPKQTDLRVKRFEFIGRLMAQALLDIRMLDLPIASAFFKWLIGEEKSLGMEDFEKLEPTIFRSMRSMVQSSAKEVEDLEMNFTYPGEPSLELMKNGKNIPVTKANCKQYMELVCYWRMIEGVRTEMEAVRRGFQLVINKEPLRIFSSDEMELLFCGCEDNDENIWTKQALQHAFRPDHGYTHDSEQIIWLIKMLHFYNKEKRRRFLQFVTGSPRLPIGGFRGLNPPLTVVKKTAFSMNNEDELPSAMTCYNYLKIPPYETYKTFVARFDVALEHVYSFYLT